MRRSTLQPSISSAATFAASAEKLTGAPFVLGGWSGDDSKVDAYSVERIMDRPEWAAAWARHAPGTAAPDVDFSTAMVVAVFTGAVVASVVPEMHIEKVTEADTIDVTLMNYVNDVISEPKHNLYVIVVLRRSTKAVRVLVRSEGLMRSPPVETVVLKSFGAISPGP